MWGPYVEAAADEIEALEASQEHVWDQLSAALSQAQKAKRAIEIDGGSAGSVLSAVTLAAEAVIGLVEEQGLQLPPTQLARLIDDLFYEIRLYHRRMSRAGDRDRDEVPRTRDLVARILKRRAAHNRA